MNPHHIKLLPEILIATGVLLAAGCRDSVVIRPGEVTAIKIEKQQNFNAAHPNKL